MNTAAASQAKFSLFRLVVFPAQTLWQRDKIYLLIFVVVNLIAGQVGVLTSLLLTWQSGGAVSDALEQNLISGALYTYSISLVVSTVAMIGSELIDAFRFKEHVRFFEHKVVWCILAGAVVLIQAPLVGALLSNPVLETPRQEIAKPIGSEGQGDATLRPRSELPQASPAQFNPAFRFSTQVIIWLLSMGIALQLYCLYRIPLIPDSHYAAQRNEEVRELTDKAEHQTETPFGEKI